MKCTDELHPHFLFFLIEYQVAFVPVEYYISEDDQEVTLCVTLLNCTEVDISVTIETVDGTARSKY